MNSLSEVLLEMMTVVGWLRSAVISPPATHSLPALQQHGGENKMKIFVAQGEDREIPSLLPSQAKQTRPREK